MLQKINRIKNLGLVFPDFTWDAAVPGFKKVNLIYGWNGCGKTTLSRLFDKMATGVCGGTEFELEDDAGHKLSHGVKPAFPVRVFNQDYVEQNLSIEASTANTITIILGTQNKDIADEIQQDTALLNGGGAKDGLIKQIQQKFDTAKRVETKVNKAFTDVARTIAAALSGSTAASRNYRSPEAKKDFANLNAKAILSDADLQESQQLIQQDLLPEISPVHPTIEGESEGLLSIIDVAWHKAEDLCSETVTATAIERLVANPDLATWVSSGVELHEKHKSEHCEYCGNAIPTARLNELAAHFNDADRKLKSKIDEHLELIRKIFSALRSVRFPSASDFYPSFRIEYGQVSNNANEVLEELLQETELLGKTLQGKKLNATTPLTLPLTDARQRLGEALGEVNRLIGSHNKQSREFSERQQKAVDAVKAHHLSTVKDEVDADNASAEALREELQQLTSQQKVVEDRLAANRAKISSTHKACEKINKALHAFLGREEIVFAPDSGTEESKGYRILRNGEPATSLSEGEKTAIALMHFLVSLDDGQVPVSDIVVVIDDPISSLDTNSMYQAFSFMKNSVKDCYQVFFLTHNFGFLKLLLNWRHRAQNKTSYYMIANRQSDGQRIADIKQMDPTLKSFESEYLFLFKTLRNLQQDLDGTIAKAYPVPNMARKLWETFLMFRVPIGANTYTRMDVLKDEGFDEEKLDAIYKFTNDQSHISGDGFDPSLVPETDKALQAIFDVMAQAAPEHFCHLDGP